MGKNNVSTISRLFLIGSFSYSQVIITYMRAWMSLKFGQIQPLVSMVTDRVIMGKTVSHFSGCISSFPFHTCRYGDMHKSSYEFEFRSDWATDCGVSCP